jgi:hypothetical protein
MLFLNVPTYDSVTTVASDDHKSTKPTRKKMHVVPSKRLFDLEQRGDRDRRTTVRSTWSLL